MGRALRDLREGLGMTQDELARALNASRSFVAQVETGRMGMPHDRFPDLARVVIDRLGQIGRLSPDSATLAAARVLATDPRRGDAFDAPLRALVVMRETTRIIGAMTQDLVEVATSDTETTLPYVVGPLIGLTLAFPDEQIGMLIQVLGMPEADESPRQATARIFQNVQLVLQWPPRIASSKGSAAKGRRSSASRETRSWVVATRSRRRSLCARFASTRHGMVLNLSAPLWMHSPPRVVDDGTLVCGTTASPTEETHLAARHAGGSCRTRLSGDAPSAIHKTCVSWWWGARLLDWRAARVSERGCSVLPTFSPVLAATQTSSSCGRGRDCSSCGCGASAADG